MKDKRSKRDKRIAAFVLFCHAMPVIGAVFAVIVSLLILTTRNWQEEEAVKAGSINDLLQMLDYIEPIESAAEEFPELDIQEDYLTVNEYSRPGTKLGKVNRIVIHYTGNPGTTAKANRDYFESLAENPVTSASSHFVIGLEGEIIQCVPLNEIAYASNKANTDSISIECCHPGESGEFNVETYNQCVALTARLCCYYHLDPETDVIRHYDVTGKECPIFYVEHPEEWEMFLGFVKEQVQSLED